MKAIDIYNFRRNLIQNNFQNPDTNSNIISELVALVESANFIINTWTRFNVECLRQIENEKDKTLQP